CVTIRLGRKATQPSSSFPCQGIQIFDEVFQWNRFFHFGDALQIGLRQRTERSFEFLLEACVNESLEMGVVGIDLLAGLDGFSLVTRIDRSHDLVLGQHTRRRMSGGTAATRMFHRLILPPELSYFFPFLHSIIVRPEPSLVANSVGRSLPGAP